MRAVLAWAVLCCWWMSGAAAHAHAEFKAGDPAPSATINKVPAEVRIVFNEPVHLHWIICKVYPLPLSEVPTDMAKAAEALVKSVILARYDTAARADVGITTRVPRSAGVTLGLKPGLSEGLYVVMWKVIDADDGHVTQGNYTFCCLGATPIFSCPNHPDVMSSEAGVCPRCGTRLLQKAPVGRSPSSQH